MFSLFKFTKTASDIEYYGDDNIDYPREIEVPQNALQLKDNRTKPARTKPCIIRYRHFNVDVSRDDSFRELVMLFFPMAK